MKMKLFKIEPNNIKLRMIAERIADYYETGGECVCYGQSPVDESTILLYPGFTAVYYGDPENVGEWGPMLDMIEYVGNDESYLEVGIEF